MIVWGPGQDVPGGFRRDQRRGLVIDTHGLKRGVSAMAIGHHGRVRPLDSPRTVGPSLSQEASGTISNAADPAVFSRCSTITTTIDCWGAPRPRFPPERDPPHEGLIGLDDALEQLPGAAPPARSGACGASSRRSGSCRGRDRAGAGNAGDSLLVPREEEDGRNHFCSEVCVAWKTVPAVTETW